MCKSMLSDVDRRNAKMRWVQYLSMYCCRLLFPGQCGEHTEVVVLSLKYFSASVSTNCRQPMHWEDNRTSLLLNKAEAPFYWCTQETATHYSTEGAGQRYLIAGTLWIMLSSSPD
jgi:hypothetical protein